MLDNFFFLDLPAIIIGIGFHEFCHAFTADFLGDPTPRSEGRVTLNLFKHLDPIGMIVLIYLSLKTNIPFGWGKPVRIDPQNFKNPIRGNGLVAIAGPIGNFLVCLIIAILLKVAFLSPYLHKAAMTATGNFIYRFAFRVFGLNLILFLFNLLPIPPLDGSKAISLIGGEKIHRLMQTFQRFGFIILIAFILLGYDKVILLPVFLKFNAFILGDKAKYVLDPAQFILDYR